MAEVKWVKLYTSILNNKKIKRIRKMPDGNSIILIWIFLLVEAGDSNKDGFLYLTEDIPFTPEDLAIEFDFGIDTIKLALGVLEHYRMIEVLNDVIYIRNWSEYQSIEGMEKVRELNRLRKQKQRDKLKDNQGIEPVLIGEGSEDGHVTVTGQSRNVTQQTKTKTTDTDIDKDIDSCCCIEDYVNQVIKHFCDKAAISDLNIKPKDIQIAEKLFTDKVPFDVSIQGVDESFKNYKAKYPGDKINSLAYCEPVIRSLWEIAKAKEGTDNGGADTDRQDTGQDSGVTYDFSRFKS